VSVEHSQQKAFLAVEIALNQTFRTVRCFRNAAGSGFFKAFFREDC
jgi:hypothetical protein